MSRYKLRNISSWIETQTVQKPAKVVMRTDTCIISPGKTNASALVHHGAAFVIHCLQ